MRAAPGPIPKKMPDVATAAKQIQRILDRPDVRLGDASIGSLIELFSDGTPVWLTGSNVWLPAVYGESPVGADYDVVFSDPTAADRFVKGVVAELNRRVPSGAGKYTLGATIFGSGRIFHPDGKGVIDAWTLGDNDSICETLMSYPEPHQRCAYYVSRSPSPGCVFRIANDGQAQRLKKSSIFGRISQAATNNYPGRAEAKQPLPTITPTTPGGSNSVATHSLLCSVADQVQAPKARIGSPLSSLLSELKRK